MNRGTLQSPGFVISKKQRFLSTSHRTLTYHPCVLSSSFWKERQMRHTRQTSIFIAPVGENRLIDDLLQYHSPWYLRSASLANTVKARDPDMRKAHEEVSPPFLTSLDPSSTYSFSAEGIRVGLPAMPCETRQTWKSKSPLEQDGLLSHVPIRVLKVL